MSETKFTEGEWVVTDTCSNYVFNVVRVGSTDIRCGTEANAHLIAAAKKMYAMLEELAVDYHCECGHKSCRIESTRREIDNILAKARGETK